MIHTTATGFSNAAAAMHSWRLLLAFLTSALLSACNGGGSDGGGNSLVSQEQFPNISVSNCEVLEGNSGTSVLQFTVSLDRPATSYVSVHYSTSDGTATVADNDYTPTEGLVTIDPGSTSTIIDINVEGDTVFEGNETLILSLADPIGNSVLARSEALGVIINDDVTLLTPATFQTLPRGIISTGGKRLPIDQAIIDNPNVSGFMVLDGWDDIEKSEGVYDWSHIDTEVARARAGGKVVRLAIHAGGDSAPAWIFDRYPNVSKIIWYEKRTGLPIQIPAFWNPAFIELKRGFYEALGNRYQDEASVFAISAAMADPNTGDWSFRAETAEQVQSYLDAGFSEALFISAYKTLLDNAMVAFRNKYVITAVGPVPLALVSDNYSAIHEVLDYAYNSYGNRLIIAKGALHAETPDVNDLSSDNQWGTILRYSPNVIGQFVWSVTNDPEYKMNGKTPYDHNQAGDIFWNAVAIGKGYNLRWIEPWSIDILNAELQGEVIAAAFLLGSD